MCTEFKTNYWSWHDHYWSYHWHGDMFQCFICLVREICIIHGHFESPLTKVSFCHILLDFNLWFRRGSDTYFLWTATIRAYTPSLSQWYRNGSSQFPAIWLKSDLYLRFRINKLSEKHTPPNLPIWYMYTWVICSSRTLSTQGS